MKRWPQVYLFGFLLLLQSMQGWAMLPGELQELHDELLPRNMLTASPQTAIALLEIVDALVQSEAMGTTRLLTMTQAAQFIQTAFDSRSELKRSGIEVDELVARINRYLQRVDEFQKVAEDSSKLNVSLSSRTWLELKRASGPGRLSYAESHRIPHTFDFFLESQVTPLVKFKTGYSLNHIYGASPQTDRNWNFEMKQGVFYTSIGSFRTPLGTLRFDYGDLAASFTPLTLYSIPYAGVAASLMQLGKYRINLIGAQRREAKYSGEEGYDRYLFAGYLQDVSLPKRMKLGVTYTLLKDDPLSMKYFEKGPLPWGPLSSSLLGATVRGSTIFPGQMYSWNAELVASIFQDKGERTGNRSSLTPYLDFAFQWNIDGLIESGKHKLPIQFSYRRIGPDYVSYYGSVTNLGLGSEIFTNYAGTSKKSTYAAPDFEYKGSQKDYLLGFGELASNTVGWQAQLKEFRPKPDLLVTSSVELLQEIKSSDQAGEPGCTLKKWQNLGLAFEQTLKIKALQNALKLRANLNRRSVKRDDDPNTKGWNFSDDNEAIDLTSTTRSLAAEYYLKPGSLRVTGTINSSLTHDVLPRPNGSLILAEGEDGADLGFFWIPVASLHLYPSLGVYNKYTARPQIGERISEYNSVRFKCTAYWWPLDKITLVLSYSQEARHYPDPNKNFLGRALSLTYYANF